MQPNYLSENDLMSQINNPSSGGVVNLSPPNSNPQSSQPQHSGSFLSHLLPTLGSIAAPIIGAALAPETGGLSLLAAAGLSGAGAAGGKLAENATEGKSLGSGVEGAGVEGLVGGAAGGVAGKAFGSGAKMLANRSTSIASKEAAQTGAQDAIDTSANTYKDISPQLQKAYNAKDSLEHATNMGFDISNPENLVSLSNNSNDVLNGVLDKALANSGPVDLSHYPQIIKDALASEGGTLGSYEKVALSRGRLGYSSTPAAKLLSQLEDLGAGVAKTNSDPNELRTLTTKLGAVAQDAKPTITAATGAIDPQQKAIYNVINNVRGQVKDALYNRPELNNAIKGEVGNLTADDVGTQQLADHLNNVITNSSDPQSLLSEISRNINIGNLGKSGQDVGQIVTSRGAQARAAAEAGISDSAAPDNAALNVAGSIVNPHIGAVKTVLDTTMHAKDNPKILSVLSRIGALGSKLAPAVGSAVATSPNLGADPASLAPGGTPGINGGTMEGSMNNTSGMPTNGVADPNSLQSILATYMHMGQVDPYLLSSTSPVVSALAPQAQKQQLAANTLGGLNSSFANAGGAQGTGGILSRISALIPGTAAHTFQGQQDAAAQALASAMGISPAAASSLLPQLMQNPQTAGLTQSILGSLQGQLAH